MTDPRRRQIWTDTLVSRAQWRAGVSHEPRRSSFYDVAIVSGLAEGKTCNFAPNSSISLSVLAAKALPTCQTIGKTLLRVS